MTRVLLLEKKNIVGAQKMSEVSSDPALTFERPTGVKADIAELLYVSALHQSQRAVDREIRLDGCISSEDVSNYLSSRHGIKITPLALEQSLFQILTHEDRFDLLELASLIFIPTFCKFAKPDEGQAPEDICSGLVDKVLSMILHDATGDDEPKEMTRELVRNILHRYGENDLASDEDLLDNMVLATEGSSEDGGEKKKSLLDRNSFLIALTDDIRLYDVGNEAKVTTHYIDILGTCNIGGGVITPIGLGLDEVADDRQKEKLQQDKKEIPTFSLAWTAEGIDYLACTYACKWHVMMAWASFFFGYLAFVMPTVQQFQADSEPQCRTYATLVTWSKNQTPFSCDILNQIVDWLLIFGTLTGFGFLYIYASSMGYEADNDSFRPHFIGTVVLTLYLVACTMYYDWDDDNFADMYIKIIAVTLSAYTVFLRWLKIATIVSKKLLMFLGNPKPSAVLEESAIKKAASSKIRRMHHNAISVTSHIDEKHVIKTYYGQALSNFQKLRDEKERVGGLFWGLRLFMNSSRNKEGIWVSARYLSTVFALIFVAIFVLIFGIYLTMYLYDNWLPPDEIGTRVVEDLKDFITISAEEGIVKAAVDRIMAGILYLVVQFLSMLEGAGVLQFDCFAIESYLVQRCYRGITDGATDFMCSMLPGRVEDVCVTLEPLFRPYELSTEGFAVAARQFFNYTVVNEAFAEIVSEGVSDNLVQKVNYWYPTDRYMVVAPMLVVTIIAFIASISMSIVLIPSYISTTLKLRSGVIPTLGNTKFCFQRYNVINISWIPGSMFWGNLGGSFFVGGLVGLLVFLALWQVSAFLIQQLVALTIAILSIIIVRWLVNKTIRSANFRSFYRVNPALGNWFHVVNECVNFALSTVIVFVRAYKLFLLSALYIGRVDISFLGRNVGIFEIGPIRWIIDPHHTWYMTNILAVEAHRHPYIETLGAIYMMKIRHAHKFMSRAGSVWRLIFVTALMPWLQTYRLMTSADVKMTSKEKSNI